MNYNLIAPFYSDLAMSKNEYLDGVNAFLVTSLSVRGNYYLDIGCGDGVRTIRLHEKLSCPSTDGVDLSTGMIDKARANIHGPSTSLFIRSIPSRIFLENLVTSLRCYGTCLVMSPKNRGSNF